MSRIILTNARNTGTAKLRILVDKICGYQVADHITCENWTAIYTVGEKDIYVLETPDQIDHMIDNPHLY